MPRTRVSQIFHNAGRHGPLALLFLLALLMTVGCRGCAREDPEARAAREAAERKKQEEEKKRDFELQVPVVMPGQKGVALNFVKPGHWATVSQELQCNVEDFVGQSFTWIVDDKARDIPIANTRYLLRSTHPVVLSKERPKDVESLFLVPATTSPVRMVRSLRQRNSSVEAAQREQWPLMKLEPYQYLFVILANEPDRYAYLKSVDAVKVPYDGINEFDDTEDTLHYQVVQPEISTRIAIPDNALSLTTVAYILWDDLDPGLFTPEQETALLDWIHWGGQLIISGPDSLDQLANSFLEPYLPARSAGARSFDTADLAEFSRGWTVRSSKAPSEPLSPERPWSGIKLAIDEQARAVSQTGELLVEREVGRGRIVVSAMQLSERELINWNPHFQNWLNACVMRRPPRQYRAGLFGDVTLLWADPELADHRLDAALTTGLRFFTRDVGVETNYRPVSIEQAAFGGRGMVPEDIVREVPPEAIGGIAAWNTSSTPAQAARAALREAAGVEVPKRSFVVAAVAIYLVVLVPLNWLFFSAIGRVEWAWIAAPLIAVLGTLVVVHQAQLDIGFVRAHTEVGILELQPEYPRGHLSRYAALYTSLATTYDLQFDNPTTLASPFPGSDTDPLRRGESRTWATIERHDQVRLTDVQVNSNSTEMVHSEQFFPLDGPIRLGTSSRGHRQVENRSQLDLADVVVLRRTQNRGASLEGVWIGDLKADQSAAVAFRPLSLVEGELPFSVERQAAKDQASRARLEIERLLAVAYDPAQMQPGEVRLVGRVDELLPGEEVQPTASQINGAVMVVAHLQYPDRPPPRPDTNAAVDVATEAQELDFFDQFDTNE